MEFLLNKFPCSPLKGEHSTVFPILSFYTSSHLKVLFESHLCGLKCTSLSKCLGELPTARFDQALPGLGHYEREVLSSSLFRTRRQSVSSPVKFRSVVAIHDNPTLQHGIPKSKSAFLL